MDGVIRGMVIPFNGVLVTRDLVEKIGSVRDDFFIWGDDHEYRLRAERAGARIGTVVDARVLHPSVGDLGTPMMFGRTTYNHSPSDLKHYCMARNNLLNLREYRGPLHGAAFVAKTVWFYTFTRPDLARLRLSAQADARGAVAATSAAIGGSSGDASTRDQRVRRRGHRDLQPGRPAWPDARRARGPDPASRCGLRGRQREHRPHRRSGRGPPAPPAPASPTALTTSAEPVASTSACGRRTTPVTTGSG